MPAIAVAAGGAALQGVIVGAATGAILKSVAVAVVLSVASQALAPKPKQQTGSQSLGGNTLAVRQPTVSRKYIYGQTRIADVYAHITSPGADNEYLHLVIILASHELTEIGEVWADDYCIPPDWLDADGNVTQGRYSGVMRIRKHLGSPSQAADPFLVTELDEWTTDHKLSGIAYLYVRIKHNRDTFPGGEPSFSAVVKGLPLHDPRTGNTGFSTNLVLAANDYLRASEYGFGAADANMDDANISAEASIADEIVDTADKDMVVASVAASTDILTLDGERLLFEVGDRCEIVAPGAAPAGLATGTDYYVIPYQFKDTPRIKLAATLADAMAGNAIDITDAGSGTITVRKNGEPRYHGGGVVDSANTLKDNLAGILSGIAGRATNTGGAWRILTGAWRTPTVTFDENDLRGSISVRTKLPISERFNSVKGLYVSSLNDFQPSDYPVVYQQTFIDQDNGTEYPRDLNLPMTTRSDTAQRIGKIELLRARQEIVVNCSLSLRGLQVQAGDNLMLNFSRYGFEAKEFEVTSFSLRVGDDEDSPIITELTLRETAEGIFTWSLDEAAAVDPAPNTTLPNAFDVTVPTGVAFSSVGIDTELGDAVYSLILAWNLHPDAFVREGGSFELQYKKSSETEWNPSFFVDGELTNSALLTSSVNVAYDLRIRARNSLGVRSGWVTLTGAVGGSSGGVGTTDDWGSVADAPTTSLDWGSVTDAPTSFEDWGSIA